MDREALIRRQRIERAYARVDEAETYNRLYGQHTRSGTVSMVWSGLWSDWQCHWSWATRRRERAERDANRASEILDMMLTVEA